MLRRNLLWVLTSLLILAPGAFAEPPTIETVGKLKETGIRHVTVTEAQSLVAAHPEIVVLDVRTGREFNGGHLEGAVNMNYFSLNIGKNVDQLDKDKTYLLYCRSGNRSGKAAPALKKAGIESVIHMDGGTKAWSQAGLPLVKDED